MIPKEEWIWYGSAGHLVIGYRARWHLCTAVGDRLVSTLGEIPKFDNKPGEAPPYETIGFGPETYETMVFHLGDAVCEEPACECGERLVQSWTDLYVRRYSTRLAASIGHMVACRAAALGEIKAAEEFA